MNLIIEQGNTMLKMAVFDDDQMVAFSFTDNRESAHILDFIKSYRPDQGIMSSVIDRDESLIKSLQAELAFFLWFDERVTLPVKIAYETVHTLGKDRIAAVIGAYVLQPAKNVLVIDAGTALTYEMLEASGIYKGGTISPGMTTRFRALNRFTQQLPLVSENGETPLIGTNTENAIRAGVVNGITFEMDGYIDAIKAKYDDVVVYLTGGHAFYFEKRLKNHIFAAPKLTLIGLNRILKDHAKKD